MSVPAWNLVAVLAVAAVSTSALAGNPVYKHVDEWGSTVYADRPPQASSKPIRNRIPPGPGPSGYDSAVLRAESDRLGLQRGYLENLQPRKTMIYSPPPGYSQQKPTPPAQADANYSRRARWDANLPASPAPSLERNYYYNGR